MSQETLNPEKTKKKHQNLKFVLYFVIVIVATAISLLVSLWGSFNEVMAALGSANPWWLALIVAIVCFSYFLDALIIKIFSRLYTRHYHVHQGLAVAMIGAFYNNVTPGASGGQVMEAYTLKKQGIQISNAASIMVMWFILYQTALIGFDLVAFAFEFNKIMSIQNLTIGSFSFPMLPIILIGFGLNLGVIVLLYGMSYSHKFHNFILHYVIGFLGKIHLVKNPDQMRENLRVQVENFKIELKRLQANIPVTIVIIALFVGTIICRNSVPYFAGLSLDAMGGAGFNISSFFEATFLSSFHQMVTGLIPLPGSAGVSEYFFNILFGNFFSATVSGGIELRTAYQNVVAAQIIWRTATFHLVLLVSGIVAALYRSRPTERPSYASRQTFVNLQLETFDERKRSVDTMFETRQLSRKEIQRKILESSKPRRARVEETSSSKPLSPKEEAKIKKKAKKKDDDDWGNIDIGD